MKAARGCGTDSSMGGAYLEGSEGVQAWQQHGRAGMGSTKGCMSDCQAGQRMGGVRVWGHAYEGRVRVWGHAYEGSACMHACMCQRERLRFVQIIDKL